MKTDEGYELIRQLIDSRAQQDPKIRSVQELIADGEADFKDTSEYSRRSSEILGTSLSEHILELDDEAREDVCKKLLHDGYEDINDVLAEVQTSLDEKTGVNIRPKKPPFQTERVATFAHSLADHTVADHVIKRRAKNGAANISMSDHDRYMKENAKLRHNAGLKCYIERDTDGSCCEWCSKMAGSYIYGEEPKDVYRRHDNCGCSVTYKNGKQRQNVWSKKTWEADKDERISKAAGKEPTVFGKAEAQAKQSEILARKELTYGGKSGIIYAVNNTQDFMDREHRNTLSRKVSRNGKSVLEKWSVRSNPLGGYSNISSETFSRDAQAMAEYLDRTVNSGTYGTLDRIVIAKNSSLRGISTYDHVRNTLFISEELITKEGFERIVDTSYFPARNIDDVITHELDGHKRHWDMVKKFYNDNLDRYSSLEDAKQDYERKLREYVVNQKAYDYFYISKYVSNNAFDAFDDNSSLNELLADCTVMYRNNQNTETELFDLVKELMKYDEKSK